MAGSSKTPRVNAVIDAGMFRRRLTIQQAVNTSDGKGGYTTSWSTVAQAWGALVPWKSFELFLGEQVREKFRTRYTIRWQPSTVIAEGMRLVDGDTTGAGGTTYTIIEATDVDGTRRQMRLTVEQVAPGT